MSQQKILFLLNQLVVGGTERNVVVLSQNLDHAKYEIKLWTLLPGGGFESRVVNTPVKIHCLNRKSPRDPIFALRAAWQIARTDASLVHTFLPTIGFYAALARRLFFLRKPIIQWVGASNFESPRTRLYWKWLCGSVDLLIANSESVKQELIKLGVDPARIVIINNGHDLAAYKKPVDVAAVRSEFQLQPDQKLLLCVSRLVSYKRVRDAIDAVPHILAKGHNVKLVIAGDGEERESLSQQIKELGLTDRVLLLGNRADVIELRRSADLFLYPSEVEGLCNSVIEACLARMSIVACAARGVVDVVQNEKEALLVPERSPERLASAVDALLRDPAKAERLAAAAEEQANRRFGMPAFVEQISAVYDRLIAKGS
ncbi:MAG: glycosyltransferase [Planctomycetota bacterium]|nr:glycosyltransferase [Planctomycetota bacterium]